MSAPLAPEIRHQVTELIKLRRPYAEIARQFGISRMSVFRIKQSPPAAPPMSPADERVREALRALNYAFERFERSQTKGTYDAWREALRIYDDARREVAAG